MQKCMTCHEPCEYTPEIRLYRGGTTALAKKRVRQLIYPGTAVILIQATKHTSVHDLEKNFNIDVYDLNLVFIPIVHISVTKPQYL